MHNYWLEFWTIVEKAHIQHKINRRSFIKRAASLAAAIGFFPGSLLTMEEMLAAKELAVAAGLTRLL